LTRTISTRIPTELHKELRERCNLIGESIRRFVRENEQSSPDISKELKKTWNELVGDHEPMERSHMIYYDINNKTN